MRDLVIPRNVCEHAANRVYLLLDGEKKGHSEFHKVKNNVALQHFLLASCSTIENWIGVQRLYTYKKKTKSFFSPPRNQNTLSCLEREIGNFEIFNMIS